MNDYQLVIGDKNYSSWSLRPWLAMTVGGIAFDETSVELKDPERKKHLLTHSPAGLVPVLKARGAVIHDSLAICETIADWHPAALLWPDHAVARAMARSFSAEMHSGFAALRQMMPMDCLSRYPGAGMTFAVADDIARIVALWREARERYGSADPYDEGFLFGRFSIADAMYAPVVSRFLTYEPDLGALGDDGTARSYMEAIWSLPAIALWLEGARAEMAERGLPIHGAGRV